MDWLQALVLGIVQGLTEYLPVSSSGHLAIGAYLFGVNGEDNLTFTVAVHIATVLSTLVVLWREIAWIFKGLFKWQMNDETRYFINILISMIPVGIVGVFFKDKVERKSLAPDLLLWGPCCSSRRCCSPSPILPVRGRRKRSACGTPSSSDWPKLSP